MFKRTLFFFIFTITSNICSSMDLYLDSNISKIVLGSNNLLELYLKVDENSDYFDTFKGVKDLKIKGRKRDFLNHFNFFAFYLDQITNEIILTIRLSDEPGIPMAKGVKNLANRFQIGQNLKIKTIPFKDHQGLKNVIAAGTAILGALYKMEQAAMNDSSLDEEIKLILIAKTPEEIGAIEGTLIANALKTLRLKRPNLKIKTYLTANAGRRPNKEEIIDFFKSNSYDIFGPTTLVQALRN